MKKSLIIFPLLFSLLCIPLAQADIHTENRYATTTFHDIYGWQGGLWEADNTDVEAFYEKNITYSFGAPVTQFGVRVFVAHANGSFDELTSGQPVAIVERASDGQGLQTNTWNFSTGANMSRASMMYTSFYTRLRLIPFGGTVWYLMSAAGYFYHMTIPLGAVAIPPAVWNFTFYTYRLKVGNLYTHRIWFGNSTHYVYLQNFQWDDGGRPTSWFLAGAFILCITVIPLMFIWSRRK